VGVADGDTITLLDSGAQQHKIRLDRGALYWRGRPARTSVNASPTVLRRSAHDSRPAWLARPSPYDSCIHYISPVCAGASAAEKRSLNSEL
jgi:hypothetical protein